MYMLDYIFTYDRNDIFNSLTPKPETVISCISQSSNEISENTLFEWKMQQNVYYDNHKYISPFTNYHTHNNYTTNYTINPSAPIPQDAYYNQQ